MLAVKSHSEENGDASRVSGAKKVWRRLTIAGREISASRKDAAMKLARELRGYFKAQYGRKASTYISGDYAVTDRQARRWLAKGPTFDGFALMLERECDRLLHWLAVAYSERRRRFRWRRNTKDA
ncbi:hypothetical protein E6C67_14305 [Azospirillum sp. TSA2s]|uniref:hypothetical protein n=1 Tax=Azospirillum sp. TSA2s TaxID=709810 RepID=UPI0010AAD44E|nr:hypothetical protein [Azospirillum sp. TSA2s]QCG95000.1 hypothetical protein E6C67_14305 [Azospirillum sp. TSA2s]